MVRRGGVLSVDADESLQHVLAGMVLERHKVGHFTPVGSCTLKRYACPPLAR